MGAGDVMAYCAAHADGPKLTFIDFSSTIFLSLMAGFYGKRLDFQRFLANLV